MVWEKLVEVNSMQIDYNKLERQQIGVDKWFTSSMYGADKDRKGVFHYYTGVGKTFTAILTIKRLFRINAMENIVILVPSDALYKQWEVILTSNFTKAQMKLISIYTPHTVIGSNIRIQTNTLIVDELDAFYSEEFIKTINGTYIRFDSNLGLTATYRDKDKREKQIHSLYPIIDEISEQEAIKKGYIANFIEFNLALNLTDEEQEHYDYQSKVIGDCLNKFGKYGLGLATKCLSGGKDANGKEFSGKHYAFGWAIQRGWRNNLNLNNPEEAQIDEIWNPNKVFGYALKLMTSIKKRKDILYNSESKFDACLELCEKFNDLKTVVFSQSTAFADKLDLLQNQQEPYSSVAYHSNLETQLLPSEKTGKLIKFGSTRLKKRALDRITRDLARVLCTASSLDKGLDIPSMMMGITASGTSNFTQYKQRGGRIKRLFGEDKVALLVNLYIKDTQDKKWLDSRQSDSSHKIFWVSDVNDVSFDYKENIGFTINEM